jgi:hypothetical protein
VRVESDHWDRSSGVDDGAASLDGDEEYTGDSSAGKTVRKGAIEDFMGGIAVAGRGLDNAGCTGDDEYSDDGDAFLKAG